LRFAFASPWWRDLSLAKPIVALDNVGGKQSTRLGKRRQRQTAARRVFFNT
jgi:hypothetical protein